MKRLLILLSVLLGLGAFVYFYEIRGGKTRDEARELEESLVQLKQDQIESVWIEPPEGERIHLERVGERWRIRHPIETTADRDSVDALIRNLALARSERTFEGEPERLPEYGLSPPRLVIRVKGNGAERILRIGAEDFTGHRIYVQLEGESQVRLTSNYVFNTADKELDELRDKRILGFQRERLERIEIARPQGPLHLMRREGTWELEVPLQERADSSGVNSLLSSLNFSEILRFVEEKPEKLQLYGLDRPEVTVRVREEGSEDWRFLEFGGRADEGYYGRNSDHSAIFVVDSEVLERLTQELWAFRSKEVIEVPQGQVVRVEVRRGGERIAVRHEDFTWTVEEPADQAGQEVLSYRFWYPISEIRFESIESAPTLATDEVEVVVELKEGDPMTYRFSRDGDAYWAQVEGTGRSGRISEADFRKLEVELKDILREAEDD